ncbi:uncharacterized protein LOC143837140 [Paroedura picta]|uniref:uncharacterized protein LOC143837140 n=1 Tax=Paroedura picta TaxID=143630 RepID=UPI0040559FFE
MEILHFLPFSTLTSTGADAQFVFFSGRIQATVLRDEPRSELTELKEELNEYVRNISNAVNEKQLLMRRSQLGQRLERYFQDNVFQIKRRWNKLQRELPAEIPEGYNIAATVPITVAMKTFTTLMELREKLTKAIEELYDLLHPILAPPTTPVLKMARAQAKTLSTIAQDVDANLNQELNANLDKLTAWLVPYTHNVQSQWRKFRKSLEPFTDQVQEHFGQGIEATEGSWKPYAGPVQEVFRQYAKVFYDLLLRNETFSHQ